MGSEKRAAVVEAHRSSTPLVTLVVGLAFWLAGCAASPAQNTGSASWSTSVMPLTGDHTRQKNILIFLDGTANNAGSETNVWKLYQRVVENNDRQTTAIYIAGVGSAESAPLSEAALGRGMEDRILGGYRFLVENFSPGDDIFLFGFSRGAHQARALAGLVAYAGIMRPTVDGGDLLENANRIIELVKKQRDAEYETEWRNWSQNQPPLLAAQIRQKLNLEVLPARIRILGVWDTVPGSSLKNYGVCKEAVGFVKETLSPFIPGVDRGERYKTDSYPVIRHISHAVSLDEKRSKFAPLLVCDPIVPELTTVNEIWFPGAHADVGGGYQDSSELPHLSLNWMIEELNRHYALAVNPRPASDAAGLAHWSIGDSPANYLSTCEDRVPPGSAVIHPSVDERRAASPVPIRWEGQVKAMSYPVYCSEH